MIWQILKTIDAKQFFGLARLFLSRPHFAIPTLVATVGCMKIAQREYGKLHHFHNKANAFRHALWNVLIAKKCFWWKKDSAAVLLWAEKITTWHEHFSPNKPIETAMDLHNNRMGREYFSEIRSLTIEETVRFLKQKAEAANKISVLENEKFPHTLVYIADENDF